MDLFVVSAMSHSSIAREAATNFIAPHHASHLTMMTTTTEKHKTKQSKQEKE